MKYFTRVRRQVDMAIKLSIQEAQESGQPIFELEDLPAYSTGNNEKENQVVVVQNEYCASSASPKN